MAFAITYRDRGKPQRIHAFSRGANDQLRENYWTGTQWKWRDRGSPGTSIYHWDVITYFEGKRRIDAFGTGYSDQHLYRNSMSEGAVPKWDDLGGAARGGPSVISYPQGGHQRVHCFVTSDNYLRANHWDGTQWEWTDHGKPSNGDLMFSWPVAITYRPSRQTYQQISCFAIANGRLFRNYWNGSAWKWTDHGKPPGTTVLKPSEGSISAVPPEAIAYVVSEKPRIHVFVAGANGHLFRRWFNGTQWQWVDQGKPPGTTVDGSPAVITYFRTRYSRRFGTVRQTHIHAFFRGADGHLHSNIRDGAQWSWFDHGTPADSSVAKRFLAAVTYRDGGAQRVYVFARGENEHLIVRHFNGLSWKWTDHGLP